MKQYIVDAFTDKPFSGNPAAVCVMENWPSEDFMMKLAGENNLSETAFIVKKAEQYHLRWFTPGTEVDLCGHATLASAFVILNYYRTGTSQGGILSTDTDTVKILSLGELFGIRDTDQQDLIVFVVIGLIGNRQLKVFSTGCGPGVAGDGHIHRCAVNENTLEAGTGHECCTFGNIIHTGLQLYRIRYFVCTHHVQNGSAGLHYVGGYAASIRNRIVDPAVIRHVLTQKLYAYVHQLHCIQGAAAVVGISGCMGRDAGLRRSGNT